MRRGVIDDTDRPVTCACRWWRKRTHLSRRRCCGATPPAARHFCVRLFSTRRRGRCGRRAWPLCSMRRSASWHRATRRGSWIWTPCRPRAPLCRCGHQVAGVGLGCRATQRAAVWLLPAPVLASPCSPAFQHDFQHVGNTAHTVVTSCPLVVISNSPDAANDFHCAGPRLAEDIARRRSWHTCCLRKLGSCGR